MTALPTLTRDTAPALRLTGAHQDASRELGPSPALWIPIDRAAQVLGTTEGALRVRCTREFSGRGLAALMPGPSGRQCWHIHRSADPRLIREASPASLDRLTASIEALQSAPKAKRDEAVRKARVVIAFRAWRASPGVHVNRDYLAFAATVDADPSLAPAPCLRMAYEWDAKASGTSTDPRELAAMLLDRRGGDRRATDQAMSDEAWASFQALYLREPPLSLSQCWRAVRDIAVKQGWTWISESRCRQLAAERIPSRVRDYARLGASAADKIHITPVSQDPDKWAPGETWIGDHSRCDFFARVFAGGTWVARRLWLTVWVDWRTRLLCGWHIDERPSATTIRLALHHAIATRGLSVPRRVWVDNGKDYQSRQLHGKTRAASKQRALARAQRASSGGALPEDHAAREELASRLGLFAMLGIETHFAMPYNHNGKARVERFFGVAHQSFDRLQPSWCGSRPGARDADALAESVSDVMTLPTLEQVREQFAAWARAYNVDAERRIEDLDGLSPLEYYERYLPERRAALPASLAELQLEVETPRVVSKHGVTLKVGDTTLRYGSGHPALREFINTGKTVWLTYDPHDLSAVNVRDEDGRLVCVAELNRRHGAATDPVSKQHLREAQAQQRRERREAQRAATVGRSILTDVERAALAARDEAAAKGERRVLAATAAEPAPPMRLVRTLIDDDAQLAQEQRRELMPQREVRADAELDHAEMTTAALLDRLGREVQRDVPSPSESPVRVGGPARLSAAEMAARWEEDEL